MKSIESVAVMRNSLAYLLVPEVGSEVFESIDVRGVHPRTAGGSIPVIGGTGKSVNELAGSLRNLHVRGDYLYGRLAFADSPAGEALADLFFDGHFNLLYPPFDFALQRNLWVKKGPMLETTDVTLLSVQAKPVPNRLLAENRALAILDP